MGKTPGKWIRTLLGKKSSKSNLSKGRTKLNSANEEESVVALNVTLDPPSVSAPSPGTDARDMVDSDKGMTVNLQNDHVNSLSSKENEGDRLNINSGSTEDSERTKHEQAATKVQATFRGYRARRAFKTLKGIIRLQAVIRGHLVRRQAVATLFCVWRIVKLQAIARGRKVRSASVGNETQRKYPGIHQGGKCSEPFGVSMYTQVQKLSKYAIVQKLLAPAPTALPLRLQYSPGEPNSAWEWLQRWTKSRFWEYSLKVNKNLGSKSKRKSGNFKTVEPQLGRHKQGVRKVSSVNVENSSNRSTPGKEKPKRYGRKVSEQLVDSAHDHPKNDASKVKQHARKSIDSTKEASPDLLEVSNEKPKHSLRKASKSAVLDISGKDACESAEKRKSMVATAKQMDVETDKKLEVSDNSLKELNDNEIVGSLTVETNVGSIKGTNTELCSKDDNISNENSQASERRASLPAKMVDHQDNGLHSNRKVPSYMAPTESAKAKLRGQESPRFSQDGFEKNGVTRRHSLPSSANCKFNSSSPRAVRLVQGSGKGLVNSDKSLSSSRDGCDKTIRAEWRR